MKPDLNAAPLFLLVEAEPDETPKQLFSSIAQQFDPRQGDIMFGPLYQIGPRYKMGARVFFQIQTYAGSLGGRLMLAIRDRQFQRAILIKFSGVEEPKFELIQPNGPEERIEEQRLLKCEQKN